MAVILRLARGGQTKRPFYRIVATEHTSRRDGKFIEIVGTLNTMVEPAVATLHEDKIRKWVKNGAQVSSVVSGHIKKQFPGLLEDRAKHKLSKIQDARRKRKARAAKKKK